MRLTRIRERHGAGFRFPQHSWHGSIADPSDFHHLHTPGIVRAVQDVDVEETGDDMQQKHASGPRAEVKRAVFQRLFGMKATKKKVDDDVMGSISERLVFRRSKSSSERRWSRATKTRGLCRLLKRRQVVVLLDEA